MPTVIRFNGPRRGDITRPTAAQLWVLTRVQDALGRVPRLLTGALGEDLAWSHHEDEDLGLPPLGTQAYFFVTLPLLELYIHTDYWHAPGDATIYLEVRERRAHEGVLSDPRTARLLSSLGLAKWGAGWRAEWKVRGEQDAAVAAAISGKVEELAALVVPVTP